MAAAAHHRELTAAEVSQIARVKQAEAQFLGLLEDLALFHQAAGPRERALAKTNIEQAAFWAVKSITR